MGILKYFLNYKHIINIEYMGLIDKITKSVYTIAIIIVLVIISVACFIFFPKGKNFFEVEKIFPDLNCIKLNIEQIKEEVKLISDNKAKLTPLVYFNKVSNHLNNAPNLYLFLTTIEGLRTAQLIKIDSEEETKKINGNAELSNQTLRAQFPILLAGSKKVGVWVDGETKFYRDNDWLIFDYSRENFNLNRHMAKHSIILSLDIRRPANISDGISKNNNNDDIKHLLEIN